MANHWRIPNVFHMSKLKKSAPRLSQPKKKKLQLRLPSELAGRLQSIAKDQGVSDTALFTVAVSEHLVRLVAPRAQAVAGAGISDAVIEGLVGQGRTVEQILVLLQTLATHLRQELVDRKAEIAALRKELAIELAKQSIIIYRHFNLASLSIMKAAGMDEEAMMREAGPIYKRLMSGESTQEVLTEKPAPAAHPQPSQSSVQVQPATRLKAPNVTPPVRPSHQKATQTVPLRAVQAQHGGNSNK